MEYTITHATRYTYSSPASVCQNLVALTPRPDTRVECNLHRLRIRPNPTNTHRRSDYFGNLLTVFSIDESHDELTILAVSRVMVRPPELEASLHDMDWQELCRQLEERIEPNWLGACSYLYDSPRIVRNSAYADYARPSFASGVSLRQAVIDLTGRIHRDFTYDPKATETQTSAEQAFQLRKGVCQDFSHVMIACLRSMGIPARYVSGYLRTIPPAGKPRLVGADQSHAWVSVYCGHLAGWLEIDPTNNCLCQCDHIPIAWGRDYTDVVPVRGAYLGGGDSSIIVSVDVVAADSTPPEPAPTEI